METNKSERRCCCRRATGTRSAELQWVASRDGSSVAGPCACRGGPSGWRRGLECADEWVVVLREEVAVAVENDGDARVPGAGGDLLGVRAGRDPERDGGVAQVVDAQG